MGLAERMRDLEPRERQLLGILVTVFGVLLVLALPIGVTAVLAGKRADNEAIRETIEKIQQARPQIAQRKAEKEQTLKRYKAAAPALGAFLEQKAKESGIEIPESQDRALVPHGKKYEERATKIVLHKVGMLSLVKFMEKVAQSGHPVAVTRLDIRKRATEPDSYDVEMIVSAYDRKPDEKKKDKDKEKPKDGEEESAPEGETPP
jgi:general secretion pathway protein M